MAAPPRRSSRKPADPKKQPYKKPARSKQVDKPVAPPSEALRPDVPQRPGPLSSLPPWADLSAEEWVDEGEVRSSAPSAVRRGRQPHRSGGGSTGGSKGRSSKGRASSPPAPSVQDEVAQLKAGSADPTVDPLVSLTKAVGAVRAARLDNRLSEATDDFLEERFDEASKVLRPIVKEAPSVPLGRELLGLTYYRLGRWKAAIVELEAFRLLTGSADQNAVLADCYRAMRRWKDVDRLWNELREASPSAAVVTEGRIVAAGALADQGRLPAAIDLLSQGWRIPKRAQEHHLRRAYALADTYERAGDVPKARELFAWVAATDRDFSDASRRRRALG